MFSKSRTFEIDSSLNKIARRARFRAIFRLGQNPLDVSELFCLTINIRDIRYSMATNVRHPVQTPLIYEPHCGRHIKVHIVGSSGK